MSIRPRLLALAAVLALGLAACGGEEGPTTADEAVSQATSMADASMPNTEELEASASEMAEDLSDMADDLEAQQSGGSASLTVDGQTWEFDGVLCAIGEEATGQEGAEFVLSAIADGVQFYLSIDSYGHSASINDIENFEDPSVSWSSDEAMSGESFIQVNGKDVSGEAVFIDYDREVYDGVPGNFSATCP